MHAMQIMDRTGHTEVRWNPRDADEVAVARATFETMREKGYRAFVSDDGDKGKRVDEFDPQIKRMIFVPQLRGG